MNKWFMLFVAFGSILLAAILIIMFNEVILNSPVASKEVSSGCNILQSNGPPSEKINIVFVSDKDKVQELSESLFSIEPYKKNKDSFNLYYITPQVYTPQCSLYKGIAIFCYSKELIKKTSICPNDIIVVSKEETENIRSSSYMNVIGLNINDMKNVLPHEFGHVFANLADEYKPAEIPRGSLNCVEKCEDFGQPSSSCFSGCSNDGMFRSVDNGLMRTLKSDSFGVFDTNLIQKNIDIVISKRTKNPLTTGKVIEDIDNSCEQGYYILVGGHLSLGVLSLEETSIVKGCLGSNGAGAYHYTIIDNDGSVMASDNFNPEIVFAESQDPSHDEISGDHFMYEGTFYVKAPLLSDAKSLQVFDDSGTMLSEISTDFNDIIKLLGEKNARPCEV